MKFASVALSALAVSLAAPAMADHHAETSEAATSAYPMTPQGAADWVAMVEQDMFDFSVEYGRVLWLNNTYIVHDSNQLAAKYGAQATEKSVTYANEAAQYARVAGLDPEVARKLDILRNGIVMPAPVRDGAATELNEIATKLGAAYGQGTGTLNGEEINGSDIEAEMGNLERTPAELAEMWTSWHDNVGAPMREDYQRMIAIANEGSKELGFADLGAMWRSNYDMDPDQFAGETERMWQEVKPLYMALHTYVRSKLNEKYGDAVQPATGPIRADLLGMSRHLAGVRQGICTDVDNHLQASPAGHIAPASCQVESFLAGEGMAFAGRPCHENTPHAICQEVFGQWLDNIQVQIAIGGSGRVGGGNQASQWCAVHRWQAQIKDKWNEELDFRVRPGAANPRY